MAPTLRTPYDASNGTDVAVGGHFRRRDPHRDHHDPHRDRLGHHQRGHAAHQHRERNCVGNCHHRGDPVGSSGDQHQHLGRLEHRRHLGHPARLEHQRDHDFRDHQDREHRGHPDHGYRDRPDDLMGQEQCEGREEAESGAR